MTTNPGSAKIYQFPARGRFAAGAAHGESVPVTTSTLPRVARAASGSSWYHEEAIRDADHTRE